MSFSGKQMYIDEYLPVIHPETGEEVHVVEMRIPGHEGLLISRKYYYDILRSADSQTRDP